MSKVVPLPPRGVPWSLQERSALRRLRRAFGRDVEIVSGRTDEGDPWLAVQDARTGEVRVHVARVDRRYVVCWPRRRQSVTTPSFAVAVDLAASRPA